MPITPRKIAIVHVAAKQLGLDDETYRAVLLRWGGVESATDLDHDGFEAVMKWFTANGFRSTWTKRTFGKRPGMATPGQVGLIRKLWAEWAGSEDEGPLNKWLERRYHVTALRFLDREAASKAVNGLRAMTKRRRVQAYQRMGVTGLRIEKPDGTVIEGGVVISGPTVPPEDRI